MTTWQVSGHLVRTFYYFMVFTSQTALLTLNFMAFLLQGLFPVFLMLCRSWTISFINRLSWRIEDLEKKKICV